MLQPENIYILRAKYEDLDRILKIQKLAFRSEAELYNDFSITPLTQSLESIQQDFKTHIFLKAIYSNEIIGSVKCAVTDNFCWIGRLIVDPDYQGNGIGRRLLEKVMEEFKDVDSFHLFTGCKSLKNLHLYESLGFVKKKEYKDEKNPEISMVELVRNNKEDIR